MDFEWDQIEIKKSGTKASKQKVETNNLSVFMHSCSIHDLIFICKTIDSAPQT